MSATLSPRTSVEELLRPVARYWWLWAAFGVLSIVAGAIALANLDLSLVALGVLFGCWLIAVGFFDVLGGVMAEDAGTARRVLAVLLGVISLIAGVMCLRLPGAGLLALVIVVGAHPVVAGVLQIASAVGEDQPWVGYALGVANLVPRDPDPGAAGHRHRHVRRPVRDRPGRPRRRRALGRPATAPSASRRAGPDRPRTTPRAVGP